MAGVDNDSRMEEALKEFVQADLRLKAVVDAVESDGDRQCRSLRQLVDLEMEARECTKTMRRLLSRLESLAGEEDNEIKQKTLMGNVENYALQLHQSQLHLRRSVLAAKKRLETNERDDLLGSDSPTPRRRRQGDSGAAAVASQVTEEMRALSNTLSKQVENSAATMDQLVQSSSTITETRREYQNMSEHIERSGRLLTKLNRREMTDRIVIFLAFAFFFITCAYIVKKRLFGSSSVPNPNPSSGQV